MMILEYRLSHEKTHRKNADKQNKTKHTTPKSKKKTSNMKPTKI
jgi:hypothetical protein